MTIDLYTVRFGAAAAAMLAGVVAVNQQADPFARVTVLVPDNLTGVMARRALGAAHGVVNVTFVTPAGLAAQLSGGTLPSVSRCVLAAAVRDTLAVQTSGLFAPVAAHRATEAALISASLDLAGADGATLADLARSSSRRTRAVVDLHRQVRARLQGLVDEHDTARQAATAVTSGTARVDDVGSLVVYLVDELAPAHVGLLRALGTRVDITVLVGLTGAADADTPVQWWVDTLERADDVASRTTAPVVASQIFSTTDSDDEVRYVARAIWARAEAGTPLARIAVLYPAADPYARLVHEHLEAAGIAHNGPAVRTLAATAAGRAARALLADSGGALGRRTVLDLAAIAPGCSPDGAARPVAAWEVLSRAAGVVGGLVDWRAKLRVHARDAPADAVAGAVELGAFVEELAARLAVGTAMSEWPALARWMCDTLQWLVGDTRSWPAHERAAYEAVLVLVEQLSALGPFDRHPDVARLARAMTAALDVPAARLGTLGVGVQVGPLEHARALDADVVFIIGLAEGLCPAPARDDTLLPDVERRRARYGELALATARVGAQHRALLAAMAAARQECIVGFPRGDHRGGRTRLASRWLLDAIGAVTGQRPTSDQIDWLDHPCFVPVPSFEAALRAAPTASHASERRLQVLCAAPGSAHLVAEGAVITPGLARGFAAVAARASAAFTEWDANLAGSAVPSPANGAVLSATSLERWAACPARYFFSSVLRLRERDSPDELEAVAPIERGSIVHEVLERFIGEVVARPRDERPAPGDPWSRVDAARLHEIASEVFATAEARGLTGPPVLWRLEQGNLRRTLDRFLVDDPLQRARMRAVPEAVEQPFGFRGEPPLRVVLDDGRELMFRGWIDRIDRTDEGQVVVFDYKTSRVTAFRELLADPVARGTKLQLPLYALAATQAAAGPTTGPGGASAHYWFLTSPSADPLIGYPVDTARLARLRSVLGVLVDGIEAGMFLANPGPFNQFFGTNDNCNYCDFDRICPRSRGDQWKAKTEAPTDFAVASYVTLVGGGA